MSIFLFSPVDLNLFCLFLSSLQPSPNLSLVVNSHFLFVSLTDCFGFCFFPDSPRDLGSYSSSPHLHPFHLPSHGVGVEGWEWAGGGEDQ